MSALLSTIDELQQSDSTNHLAAKRAERDLREEREKCLRLERELEGWKALRMERGSHAGSRRVSGLSGMGLQVPGPLGEDGRPGSARGSQYGSINRKPSGTKGFL